MLCLKSCMRTDKFCSRSCKASTVELNRLSGQKNIQNDGAMIHFFPSDQTNSIVKRNWASESSKGCYRFDDPGFGTNGTITENVCWKVFNAVCTKCCAALWCTVILT